MNKSNKFSAEVRERAVRMVQEHRGEYPSQCAEIEFITPDIGCTSQTLLRWVKREEVDSGEREDVISRTVPSPTTGFSAPRHLTGYATAPIASSSRARASSSPNRCPKTAKSSLQNPVKNRILEAVRFRA